MNTLHCPVTRAENNFAARLEPKQSLHEAALTLLANEFVNAMRGDARLAKVSTPGFADEIGGLHSMTLVDAVSDLFAGKDGDDALAELLGIVSAASKGEQVQFRAARWIAVRAGVHAEFHADDLARALQQ
jgi:hypothetical protein